MSVRYSLLAILDQGACYGYQLRGEFLRRTGSGRVLNVGQIYNTLERLRRDGLVRSGDTDEHGHVYWQITEAGSAAVSTWLIEPAAPGGGPEDLAAKVALAASLPGVDVSRILEAQRAASEERLHALRSDLSEDASRAMVLDALILAADAEVRWLDLVADRIAEQPAVDLRVELSRDRPKRGRPARDDAPVS